jgi:hypothetical protein
LTPWAPGSPSSGKPGQPHCGKLGCRCQGDPPQLHGPYWQWSHKVAGKTVTRRLTPDQARLYQQWIANRRRLDQLLARMQQVSSQAAEILLRDAKNAHPRPVHTITTTRAR